MGTITQQVCACIICQSQNLAGSRTIRPLLVHLSLDGGALTGGGTTCGISLVTAGAESSIVNGSSKWWSQLEKFH